jgi:hypothetical protein
MRFAAATAPTAIAATIGPISFWFVIPLNVAAMTAS